MDLLPVPPSSTNKVNASINLANDGGSKSNTGYMNQRDGESVAAEEEKGDEVTLSTSKSKEEEEDTPESEFEKFWGKVKEFVSKVIILYRKIFGGTKIEVENIFEEVGLEEKTDINEEDDSITPEMFQENPENEFS